MSGLGAPGSRPPLGTKRGVMNSGTSFSWPQSSQYGLCVQIEQPHLAQGIVLHLRERERRTGACHTGHKCRRLSRPTFLLSCYCCPRVHEEVGICCIAYLRRLGRRWSGEMER